MFACTAETEASSGLSGEENTTPTESQSASLVRLAVSNDHIDVLLQAVGELRATGRAKFLVVACGSGTVDVAAYELNAFATPARVRPLHRAIGGAFGSICTLFVNGFCF